MAINYTYPIKANPVVTDDFLIIDNEDTVNIKATKRVTVSSIVALASGGGGATSINGLSDGTTSGSFNVGLGASALSSLTYGTSNSALGYQTLKNNTTGSENTASGAFALLQNTTGRENICTGSYTLNRNTTGDNNTALGTQSLRQNTTGDNNTASGNEALTSNTTGSYNIGIGRGAGDAITTGSNNTIIGDYAGTTSLSDTVVIAAGSTERLKVTATSFTINNSHIGVSGSFTAGGQSIQVDLGIITGIGS